MDSLARRIRLHLTRELRRAEYNRTDSHPLAGHCYVASEAYYHLYGGKAAGLTPMRVRHEGVTHWYLRRGSEIIDLTADQFSTPIPYENGRGIGFLTDKPSRRAQVVMARVLQAQTYPLTLP